MPAVRRNARPRSATQLIEIPVTAPSETAGSGSSHSDQGAAIRVIAIYGTNIGVRCLASIPHGGWNDRTRAAELDESVSRRIVAWGMVSFLG
jgi:hypothetical protein